MSEDNGNSLIGAEAKCEPTQGMVYGWGLATSSASNTYSYVIAEIVPPPTPWEEYLGEKP